MSRTRLCGPLFFKVKAWGFVRCPQVLPPLQHEAYRGCKSGPPLLLENVGIRIAYAKARGPALLHTRANPIRLSIREHRQSV